jgi:hypothetical protein
MIQTQIKSWFSLGEGFRDEGIYLTVFIQVSFLIGLGGIGEIRTLFGAEV